MSAKSGKRSGRLMKGEETKDMKKKKAKTEGKEEKKQQERKEKEEKKKKQKADKLKAATTAVAEKFPSAAAFDEFKDKLDVVWKYFGVDDECSEREVENPLLCEPCDADVLSYLKDCLTDLSKSIYPPKAAEAAEATEPSEASGDGLGERVGVGSSTRTVASGNGDGVAKSDGSDSEEF